MTIKLKSGNATIVKAHNVEDERKKKVVSAPVVKSKANSSSKSSISPKKTPTPTNTPYVSPGLAANLNVLSNASSSPLKNGSGGVGVVPDNSANLTPSQRYLNSLPDVGPASLTSLIPDPTAPNTVSAVEEKKPAVTFQNGLPYFNFDRSTNNAKDRLAASIIQGFTFGKDPQGRDLQTLDPIDQLGYSLGAVGSLATLGLVGGKRASIPPSTVVSDAAIVGAEPAVVTGSGLAYELYVSNTKTVAQTEAMLAKMGGVSGVGATALIAAIGSYPFAGFIKEESLQTLGFGLNAAIKAGDLEGAMDAILLQEEILNPDLWDRLLASIPYANVVANLADFYNAARAKLAVDRKLVEDLRQSVGNGSSGVDWAMVQQQESASEMAVIDYYNSERQKLLEWEADARRRERKEEAAFWAEQQKKQAALEAKERESLAAFWLAYRKRAQKISEDNGFSKLNFGLL